MTATTTPTPVRSRRTQMVAARAAVLAAATAWLATGVGAGPAAAHSDLIATTPAADAVLEQAPEQIALTFSEDVQADFTQIAVLDPAGADTAASSATVEGAVVAQPVTVTEPGAYAVSYRIVSADGHTVDGTYSFTYTPPTDDVGDSAAAPSAGSQPSTSTPDPTTATEDASAAGQQTGGLPAGWLLGGGAAAVAVLAAAVLRARRRPRP